VERENIDFLKAMEKTLAHNDQTSLPKRDANANLALPSVLHSDRIVSAILLNHCNNVA
jgi:hypothetical protein